MFFDLSSMQPEDITRAVDSAKDYINNHMAPADMAAAVSLVSSLSMDQDFTNDKTALLKAVSKYDGSRCSGLRRWATKAATRMDLRRLLQLYRRRQRVQRTEYRHQLDAIQRHRRKAPSRCSNNKQDCNPRVPPTSSTIQDQCKAHPDASPS